MLRLAIDCSVKLTRFLHRTTVIETDSGALMLAASSSFAISGIFTIKKSCINVARMFYRRYSPPAPLLKTAAILTFSVFTVTMTTAASVLSRWLLFLRLPAGFKEKSHGTRLDAVPLTHLVAFKVLGGLTSY